MSGTAKRTIANEGIAALWKGVNAACFVNPLTHPSVSVFMNLVKLHSDVLLLKPLGGWVTLRLPGLVQRPRSWSGSCSSKV